MLLTHAFNRNYTVASPKTFDAYRTPSGLAIVRHYSLNENMMFDKNDKRSRLLCRRRRTSRSVLHDGRGAGHGEWRSDDDRLPGRLQFRRGFPIYVRNFNANFLALPALPSSIVANAASDPDVVVREIRSEHHGVWYSVVNTSLREKKSVEISLPAKNLRDAVTGEAVASQRGAVQLDLYPCQLRALHCPVN